MDLLDIAIYATAAIACFSIGATLGMVFAWYTAREQAADLRRRFTWDQRPQRFGGKLHIHKGGPAGSL